MPDQSAHLADFRKSGNKLFCYASFYVGRQVLQGTVTLVSAFPVTRILYTTTSGSSIDVKRGFRLDVFTAAGLWKGRTRVGFDSSEAITSTTLPVRELSRGMIDLQAGDLIRVYRDLRLSDLLVDATAGFNPDGSEYSDANSNPDPLPVSGSAWAGWTRMLPAVMTGEDSATVDPDSTSPVEHDWITDGLTISVGSGTTENVSLTGTWGEYLVEHQVTDPDNGKTISQFVPVVIHDAAHPPYKVEIESLPNDEQRGGSAQVRMLGNVPLTDVPYGALCILWKEEFVAGTRQSFGARAPGRSHVLLVGILRTEEGEGDGATGAETLTFEVISPMARLDEIMGFGHVMISDQTPDAWHLIKSLTVWRGLIQVLQVYSTLLRAGYDLVFTSTAVNEDYSGFFLDGGTPLTQARDLALSLDCRLIEDRRGRFEVQMIPEQVALSDRAALPITLALAARDLLRWRYTQSHWRPVNRIEVHGFIAGRTFTNGVPDNLPIFSEWPGKAVGVGTLTSTVQKKIVSATDSQNALNARAGRLGAALDGIYVDADGELQMALDLELTLRGVYDVFDFYDELVEVQVVTRKRGLDFDGYQYVLAGSEIRFQGGSAKTTIRLRTCTNGAQGSTYVPPTANVPPYTPPGNVPMPAVTGRRPGLLSGTADLVLANSDSHLYWIDLATHALDRLDLTTLTPALQGTLIDFVVDPFSPLYLRSGANVNGMLVTTTHAYYVTGLQDPATVALTNEYAFRHSATAGQRGVQSTRSQPGFFGVNSHDAGTDIGGTGKNDVDVTLNNGATWTRTIDLGSAYPGGGGDNAWGAIHLSEHTPNRLWVVVYAAVGSFTQVYQSNDAGASWSPFGPATYRSAAQSLHLPYQESAESFLYVGAPGEYPPTQNSMHNVKLTASGFTEIQPVTPGQRFGSVARFALKTYDLNASIGLLVGYDAITGEIGVWKTADAFANFTTLFAPVAFGNGVPVAGNIAGDNANYLWLWGQRCFKRSVDGGSTWEDYSSEIAAAYPTALNFLNIAGVG